MRHLVFTLEGCLDFDYAFLFDVSFSGQPKLNIDMVSSFLEGALGEKADVQGARTIASKQRKQHKECVPRVRNWQENCYSRPANYQTCLPLRLLP